MKEKKKKERCSILQQTTSFDVHHNYTTIEQYSQISDGFYRIYKGTGWGNTTGGIINADQTKLGGTKRKVYEKGKGDPDVQMCKGGEGGREKTLKICTRMSSIPLFVGEEKRVTGKEIEERQSDSRPGEMGGRGARISQTESSNKLVQHRRHRNGVHQRWVHLKKPGSNQRN